MVDYLFDKYFEVWQWSFDALRWTSGSSRLYSIIEFFVALIVLLSCSVVFILMVCIGAVVAVVSWLASAIREAFNLSIGRLING